MAGGIPELPVDIETVRGQLLEWYADHKRPFPWRETTDPYAILVLEVMSQQTQLNRAEDAWTAFVDRWPTVDALAAADQASVVGFWTDHRLGYNRRARYLSEAAARVVEDHDGQIPADPAVLEELPGVGPYTANAVASFAYNAGGPVVDTNVKRVLYRAVGVRDSDAAYRAVASELLPLGGSRAWNNAIMDLGAVACKPTPACDAAACPWRGWCTAYETGDFTAPDVPGQAAYEGSRRQFRGRVVRVLHAHGPLPLDDLGMRVRVDYSPAGEYGREWLHEVCEDLVADGLVTVSEEGREDDPVVGLRG